MADPLTIFCAVTGGMRLLIEGKKYFDKRKKRKKQNETQPQQQQLPQYLEHHHIYHHIHHISTPITTQLESLPSTATASAYHNNYKHTPAYSYLPAYNCSQSPMSASSSRWLPPAQLPYHYFANPNYSLHDSSSSRGFDQRCYAPSSSSDLEIIGGLVAALAPAQEAPHSPDFEERIGIRTGRDPNPRNSLAFAQKHWRTFQQGGAALGTAPAIAVVHWDAGNVDMFVEIKGVYYRNYQVNECNVVAFASLYQAHAVFSGELCNGMLIRCNREIQVISELSEFEYSTNSWVHLGLSNADEDKPASADDDDDDDDDPVFLEMAVAAIFGILCCLYESPWELNVNMESSPYDSNQTAVARISSHKPASSLRRHSAACRFTVFSFNTGDWASQEVFIG